MRMFNSRGVTGSARGLFLGLAIVAGVSVASWHGSATATASRLAAQPASVATIDLNRVMEGLQSVKERNAALRVKGQERQKELDALQEQLKKLDSDLDQLAKDSKERINIVARGIETRQTLQSKAQIYQQLINLEKGEVLREAYAQIEAAAKALAEKEGYDLVVVDDRAMIQIPDRASDQEVSLAAQSRKVLYAGASLDITDRIITQLNNQASAPR